MKKLVISMTFLFLLGCATSGTKLEADKIQQIKEGMTKQEVVQLLGNPSMVNLTSDGKTILMYQYIKVKNNASSFIPVVGLFTGSMDMKQQIFQVLLDRDDKVEKYIFNNSDSQINSGLLNTK